MSYNLVFYGNETLASEAARVENIDGELSSLIDDMFSIMYKEKGIGLAAPQIDLARQVFVVDTGAGGAHKFALINPQIIESSSDTESYEEGCLSVPGIAADVIRPSEVFVKALNRDGKEVEIEATGLLARVFQHEIDHLNGILFVDRVEKYLRDEMRNDLKKIKKMNRE